jgi:predicted acyl esterase
MASLRATVAVLLLTAAAAGAAKYDVVYRDKFTIHAAPGVVLHADGYFPVPRHDGERFPLVVLPNSWGMPQEEYLSRCKIFAERGYVAYEYETRGWWNSTGEIDCAGPKDWADSSAVLDHVLAEADQFHINASQVAFAGISYGAGLTLFAAALDPRVKAGLVLSGWNNITQAFYTNETPNEVWGGLLMTLAKLVGKPSANLTAIWKDLNDHEHIAEMMAWTAVRSPERLLAAFNAKRVPLFISSNFLDRLFKPQMMLHFFERLTVPKQLLLNVGIHAEPEILQNGDPNGFIWSEATAFLDHFLKGIDNDVMDKPAVRMQLGKTVTGKEYVPFKTWPSAAVNAATFKLTPRGGKHYGGLEPVARRPAAAAAVPANVTETLDKIRYSRIPGLSSGTPIVSDLVSTVGMMFTEDLSLTPTDTCIVYLTPPLAKTERVCGTPTLDLSFRPTSANGNWQVYGFLYDVDALGVGELMGGNSFTHYHTGNGVSTSDADVVRGDGDLVHVKNLRFRTTCVDVERGHRIGVGLALYNELFLPASGADASVELHYEEASLTMPFN